MEQNRISIILGTEKLDFEERDQIGGLLYKQYHTVIDPWIENYENALKTDSKAIGSLKLAALKAALTSKKATADIIPFAGEVKALIEKHRMTYEYDTPDIVLYDMQDVFKHTGKQIFSALFEHSRFHIGFSEWEQRVEAFQMKYIEDSYRNDYCGSLSLQEFVNTEKNANFVDDMNEYISIFYEKEAKFWDSGLWAEMERYGNFDNANASTIVAEALKEIEWRQEYLKKPVCNSMIVNIRTICEKAILELIFYTSQALELNLNLSYFSWDSYQACLNTEMLFRERKLTDCKTTIIQALKAFPFDKPLYKYILQEFGDPDGMVTALAHFFGLEVDCFKEELFKEHLKSLPTICMDSEQEVKDLLQQIIHKKKFLGYQICTDEEKKLEAKLEELDIRYRTVRGKLYETREEAEKVRNDYILLDSLITNIEFHAYDLFNPEECAELKKSLFSASYASDAFKENHELILEVVEPVLKYHQQLQEWQRNLNESKEPWKAIKEILNESGVFASLKEKIKYWDFDGLKKYYPTLAENERPLLYFQIGLFGWGNYFVLTNKHALHVTKNSQISFPIEAGSFVNYQDGKLIFCNKNSTDSLSVPMKYPDEKVAYLQDVLTLVLHSLQSYAEALFERPADFYPNTDSKPSTQEMFGRQLKGLFEGKVSPFLKNTKKSWDTLKEGKDHRLPNHSYEIHYCPYCGQKVTQEAIFCSQCGAKIRQ